MMATGRPGVAVMIPSQQGNLPQWPGQGFEIWFFVVLVPGEQRALWVRMTRFASAEGSDARVWATVSEHGGVTMQRERFELEAMSHVGEGERFHLRVGESELGHGFARGTCGRVRWDLRYEATDPVIERLPKLPKIVPLGTHATHPHGEAEVEGWVELDGRRIALDGGLLTQMHIWGTQRVEFLRWAWAPRFGDGDASLELTAVAPKADGQNLCALWARIDGEVFDNSGLGKSVRAQLQSLRPGVVHHVGGFGNRRLVVRCWARPPSFAGWDYRKVGGGELHVAQSNQAEAELELYRRAGLGWEPVKRLRSTCAALEFHGPDHYPELGYVGWDEVEVARKPVPEPAPSEAQPPGPGAWIETPAPARIIGLALTYAGTAKQLARKPEPLVFELDAGAWTAAAPELVRPSSARLREVLARLEDPASQEPALRALGFLPAMLDYEVELGLLVRRRLDDPADIAALADGELALLVANDASARVLQILGEDRDARMDYWSAAKSLPGFVPTTARAWQPERVDLDAWPALELEARVNGELRQQATLARLSETPRQLLRRVLASCGPLPAETLILTGTPPGPAMSVPRWKQAVGERLLDRLGRLRVALGGFSGATDYLRPGDLVRVSGGYLGAIEQLVVAE